MNFRLHIIARGAVQGVGFRPFIYRLANELRLNGFVNNSTTGVFIEVEGEENILRNFLGRIEKEKPPLSVITSLEHSFLDTVGYKKFEIKESSSEGKAEALILPDIAVCKECLYEMFDSNNRRYLYPFINCTNCGPRFSIIESLPYDRPNTSMKIFEMCDDCRKEYEDPTNRRFHAQPIACPNCGPILELCDKDRNVFASYHQALLDTVQLVLKGNVVALKGLGGFQLIVDARNDEAINILRTRKHRDEKPFALMFPNIEMVKEVCIVSDAEERALLSPESPIVLLRKKNDDDSYKNQIKISEQVAPRNPYLGIMLPYTPLHHLLMKELIIPIVATSGNLSEEPMCIDNTEALERLKNIVDCFLVHNRPIVRHVDDSILRIVKNRQLLLRRARGYAPLPIQIREEFDDDNESILSLGAHLKNTVSFKIGKNIFVSQHIGDLSTEESNRAFKDVIKDFSILYSTNPEKIIADMHPEYLSTKHAKLIDKQFEQVQHHYAHVAGCKLENQVEGDALGVSWDGTGFGFDKTVWGGEFFYLSDDSYSHIGQFKKFLLPGGEAAIKESRRSAIGVLYSIYGKDLFDHLPVSLIENYSRSEHQIILKLLDKKINTPITTSVGRLFDAVSSLLRVCQQSNYEGQAAMMLEFIADRSVNESYEFSISQKDIYVIDWHPMLKEILSDIESRTPSPTISTKFHNSLAKIILEISKKTGFEKVILSGGCFQNIFLLERTIDLLEANRKKVYWHQRVPPNDGGISLGQIAAYLYSHNKAKKMKQIISHVQVEK